MKKYVWKASAVCLLVGVHSMLAAYLAGYTTCMHQHVTTAEQNRVMRGKDGEVNMKHYIMEAFKDYKRMFDDPLGLKKAELE